ncbi:MAG: NAD-dependent epimerase/dehydratase family protein [Chloroflexota bacterium]
MTDQEQPENSTLSVYITGAATTYGITVIEQLVADGHTVTAHALTSKEAAMLRGAGALPVYGDRDDMAVTRGNIKMAEADTVVHLAPMDINTAPLVRRNRDEQAAIYAKEVEAVVEAAKQAEIQYFVLASFAFLYADSDEPVDETAPARNGSVPLFEAALAAEKTVLEMGGCVLRVGYLYSDREDDPLHGLMTQLRRGLPMLHGKPENKANWLRADDLAAAVVAATTTAQAGKTFNIVSDSAMSEYDFTSSFAEQVGLRLPNNMPGFMANNVYGKTHIAMLNTNVSATNDLAKSELGWEPKYADMTASMDDLLLTWRASQTA